MEHLLKIATELKSLLGVENSNSDIQDALRMIFKNYHINEKSSALSLYELSDEDKAFKMFFVAKHTEGLSEKSLKYYNLILSNIFKRIQIPFLKIKTDDIRMYFANRGLIDRISKATMNNERRVLNSFYNWLHAEEYLAKNPMVRIKNIKQEKRIKQPFSEEEIEIIRKFATGFRDKAIIEVLYSTGVRISELQMMNISDINFLEGTILVFGKGKKERIVYLNTKAKMQLREYLDYRKDSSNALFIAKKESAPRLTISGISAILKTISAKSNVKNVHAHRFRRTTASTALNRGMPIEEVKEMLGHDKIETTTIYARSNKENISTSHRKYLT